MPNRNDRSTERLELVRMAFAEVLDATKHQDDKIGRFLTAIAFLTTGAIALLFGGSAALLDSQFELRESGVDWLAKNFPLIAWAGLSFFVCILASVAMLLLTLAAPLRLPGRRLDYGERLTGSRIFFSIAEEPVDDWLKRWVSVGPTETRRDMVRQYILETHNLAERARTKHTYTNIAASLFILALLFLGLAIVLALIAAVDGGRDVVQSSWALPAGVATIAVLHSVIQLYARYSHDRRSFLLAKDAGRHGPDSEAGKKFRAAGTTKWLFVSVPMFILGVAWPGPDDHRWFGGILVVAALAISFWATRPRWEGASGRSFGLRFVLYGVAPATLAVIALTWSQAAQLVVAVLPAVWLSMNSIYTTLRREVRSVNAVRRASAVSVVTEKVGSESSSGTTGDISGDAAAQGDPTS